MAPRPVIAPLARVGEWRLPFLHVLLIARHVLVTHPAHQRPLNILEPRVCLNVLRTRARTQPLRGFALQQLRNEVLHLRAHARLIREYQRLVQNVVKRVIPFRAAKWRVAEQQLV